MLRIYKLLTIHIIHLHFGHLMLLLLLLLYAKYTIKRKEQDGETRPLLVCCLCMK